MSDDVTAAILTRLEATVASLVKSISGNGGEGITHRLSHLERTDKDMRAAIEKVCNDLDMLARPADAKVQEAKWRAWAEIGVAAGVVASLVLHMLKLIGVMS